MRPTVRTLLAICLVATLAAVAMTTGCTAAQPVVRHSAALSPTTFPLTVTDDASRTVTIRALPKRVVSLAPADTEIVTGVGLPLADLVGVTTFDDYPPSVRKLPKVGDFMTPNIEAITAQRPDLILLTGGVQGDVVAKLEGTGAAVIVVDPKTLPGLYRSIDLVGSAVGRHDAAAALVAHMKASIDVVSARVSGKRTTTFVEIGYDPLFTAGPGTLVDDLVNAAGGTNVVTKHGYVPYSVEQLLKDDPQVYLAVKGTSGDPGSVASRPGFAKLSAVRAGRVVILDDNVITRPGPRVVAGVQAIARALHPDAFK